MVGKDRTCIFTETTNEIIFGLSLSISISKAETGIFSYKKKKHDEAYMRALITREPIQGRYTISITTVFF